MRTSETIDQIAKALATAQGAMKNAALNKVNPHFKSRYADLAEIRDATVPHLAANGISVAQGTDVVDGSLVVVTRLMHASGQWIESVYPLAIGKPQEMGSAYTYAKRYSLSAMCCIAADEDDDGNAGNDAVSKVAAPKASKGPDARDNYTMLVTELRKASTTSSLREWKELRQSEIDKLPDDWFARFKEDYTAHRDELAAKGA